jgi:hypothetical protein
MRLLPAVAASVGLAGLACGSPTPQTPVDKPWDLATRMLIEDGKNCFADFAPYCIDDPAFVAEVLADLIDSAFDGEVPATERGVKKLVMMGRSRYSNDQTKGPVARARVEQLIRDHYDSTPGTIEGDRLVVDLGVVPGSIDKVGRTTTIAQSEMLADHEYAGPEAASMLSRHLKAHPTLNTVELQIRLPRHSALSRWTYRYARSRDRIFVTRPDETAHAYSSPKLGGDFGPYLRGEASLATEDLKLCPVTNRNWGDDPDCPVGELP